MAEDAPHFSVLVQQADEARQRQLWETSIDAYQKALRQNPQEEHLLRLKLGLSYEGKSRDKDSQAFLILAMEQYRRALKINPRFSEAYDAFLSVSTKTQRLEESLDELQAWLKKDPGNEVCRSAIKKLDTLLMLQAGSRRDKSHGPPPFTAFLLNRALPALGIGLFIVSFFIRMKSAGSPVMKTISSVCMTGGALLFAGFILYAIYRVYRFFSRP